MLAVPLEGRLANALYQWTSGDWLVELLVMRMWRNGCSPRQTS
jgi:hypothetical protein